MAEIADQVRHGDENLMLGFAIPFWLFGCLLSSVGVHLMWHYFSHLTPTHRSTPDISRPVVAAFGLSLIITLVWWQSPGLKGFYNTFKILLTINISCMLLGLVYGLSAWPGLWRTLFASLWALVISFGFYYLLCRVFRSEASPPFWLAFWSIARVGLPYTFMVTLFSCWQKAHVKSAYHSLS